MLESGTGGASLWEKVFLGIDVVLFHGESRSRVIDADPSRAFWGPIYFGDRAEVLIMEHES